jgi:transcriptional regulator GlxA family with amidase domain
MQRNAGAMQLAHWPERSLHGDTGRLLHLQENIMKYLIAGLLCVLMLGGAQAAPIKVAFVLSEGANVMDIAGPWEVFQDTMLDNDAMPFVLYTVAASKAPLHTSGSGAPGMTITPDYSFDDAPVPDIVVVGAQSGGLALREWLKRQHAADKTLLSICTGAFELANAGLLNGKPAATHHDYADTLHKAFPDIQLVREVRYVQADKHIYTAGGLTSGIDLSLHIVAQYFGDKTAQRTADFLEYQKR